MRNRTFTLTIYGSPISKMRARLNCGYSQRRFYDAQQHEKQAEKIFVSRMFDAMPQFEGPCRLDALYYMPIKKSHNVPEGSYHYYKADLDNLLKWTMDNLTQIVYKNDCIIAEIFTKKIYSKEARAVITITELEYGEDIKEVPKFDKAPCHEHVLRRLQGCSGKPTTFDTDIYRRARPKTNKSSG